MPRLALVLIVVWFGTLFVLRSILQWWRTGSTGMKGISGRVGSLEWNAGVLVTVALLVAGIAPLAALYGWPGGTLLLNATGVHLAGAALGFAGTLGALVAQVSMGPSWRIGVDENERTALVTHGVFRFVRNPIFSFMLISMAGLVLLLPTVASVLALVLALAGIEIQVRAVEEPYLRRVHGSAYESYCTRTGRFLPGLGTD